MKGSRAKSLSHALAAEEQGQGRIQSLYRRTEVTWEEARGLRWRGGRGVDVEACGAVSTLAAWPHGLIGKVERVQGVGGTGGWVLKLEEEEDGEAPWAGIILFCE